MDTIRADAEQFCHLNIRYNRRDRTETTMLLRGNAEQVAEHARKLVRSALTDGDATSITLLPVPPYQVWDLEKNS